MADFVVRRTEHAAELRERRGRAVEAHAIGSKLQTRATHPGFGLKRAASAKPVAHGLVSESIA